MKKYCLILPMLFYVLNSNAQHYYPMFGYDHTWYVDYRTPTSSPRSQNDNLAYTVMNASGDTIFNSKQYFKAKIYWGNYSTAFDTTLYFREDTTLKEVWMLLNDSGKEKLLYNYSLNKGDSIYLDFDFQDSAATQYYTRSGWYHVDSISTIAIITGQRKAFFLSNPKNQYDPILFSHYPEQEWIEGIGSTIMPDYTQHDIDNNAYLWGYYWSFYYIMQCSFTDSERIYHNPALYYSTYTYTNSDSCTLTIDAGIPNINKSDFAIRLSPNPCNNILQINAHLSQTSYTQIEVFNVNDVKIFDSYVTSPSLISQSEIDVSQYPPGMYFLRLSANDTFEMSKFVKY